MIDERMGAIKKKQFYKKTVPPEISGRLLDFANDLSEITSRESWHEDDGQKNLENKMAVIYLDGNKQSEMAAQFGLEKFKAFREYTHDRQKEFLAAVFKDICEDQPGERTSNEWYHWDGRKRWVRFETLLWGGDDILLVVPAWQGWELVRTFFDHVTGNKTGLDAWQFEDAKFTYSAGLVLCSYKASIHRMRKLAEDLLIQGKKQTQHGTHENWLGYEVLESFDVAGEDLEHWRAARLTSDKPIKSDPEGLKKTLLLRPDQIAPVAAMVRAVHDEVEKPEKDISRRKLEAFARTMRTHPIADVQFDKAVEQYLNSVGPFKVCGELTTRQKLHHLAALWDYLA